MLFLFQRLSSAIATIVSTATRVKSELAECAIYRRSDFPTHLACRRGEGATKPQRSATAAPDVSISSWSSAATRTCATGNRPLCSTQRLTPPCRPIRLQQPCYQRPPTVPSLQIAEKVRNKSHKLCFCAAVETKLYIHTVSMESLHFYLLTQFLLCWLTKLDLLTNLIQLCSSTL